MINSLQCIGTGSSPSLINGCLSLTDYHYSAILRNINLVNLQTSTSPVDISMTIETAPTGATGIYIENLTLEMIMLIQELPF